MSNLVRPLNHVFDQVEVLLRLGRLDVTAELLDTIAQVFPDVLQLHMFRGWLRMALNEADQAVAAFRIAVGRNPLDALAWHGLAETTTRESERAGAMSRARFLNPDGAQAQLWHDLHSNKPHLAVTTLHAFHQRFPDRPEIAVWLAETHRRLGNDAQGRLVLAPWLRRRPRSAPVLFLAAALAEDGGSALLYQQEALRFDPLGISVQQVFPPDARPFLLPPPPTLPLPPSLATMLDRFPSDVAPRIQQPSMTQRGARTSVAKSAADPAPVPAPAPVDQETTDVLNAVEQATQRLFGRTSLAAQTDQTTALLVTHVGALTAAYDESTANAIIAALDSYGQALASRGVRAQNVFVDQRAVLSEFGAIEPVGHRDAATCKQVIDQVRAALEAKGQDVDAVVLIGGDGIVPFHRLPNPSQDADRDVPSDNPYGCGAGSELAPDLIVARFPDGGADSGRLLLEQIQRATDYHYHWHNAAAPGGVLQLPFMRRIARQRQVGAPVTAWGACAEAWHIPSQAVYGEVGSTRALMVCPPATPYQIEAAWPSDGRLLYFNLHGLPGGPNWYGQAGDAPPDTPLPVALTPDDIGAVAPAMICISEACYGAEIINRTPTDAIALRLLDSGALAFVGSTVTAYGAVGLPLGGADLLTQQTLQNLRRGHPLGRAVALARDWMAREVVQRQGYLDPDDAKTLLSFVILGDPWATPYARPVLERKAALPHQKLMVVQRQPIAPNFVAPASIASARQMIAKVAPNLARVTLTVLGQGRPDRIAKGQAGAIVFSATDVLATSDGQSLPQIARVTVTGGEARKLLLSH